jgi:threonine aldolase
MIDLRSDTLTRPGKGMLNAMLNASVGDDVFREDPSVNALETYVAQLFGMEAALFCCSGTQTNQIAIKCHTQPGDEVICDETAHVYIYEGGGIAFNSGCQVKPLKGDRGRIHAEQIESAVNNRFDVHKAFSRLVCIEQTANRGGGSCYTSESLLQIQQVCKKHDLKLHLDGARLFNAIVAGYESPQWYGKIFDSISICLSKGLGAPVGSVLAGNADFIEKARRIRKVMGGGMRQAGFMAAAGLYALENNIPQLEMDHVHAHAIADTLITKNFIGKVFPVETNILLFETVEDYTAEKFVEIMKNLHILCLPIDKQYVRMVTHLDVNTPMVEKVIDVIKDM